MADEVVSGTGIDSATLSLTLNHLFANKQKKTGGARGYSMLMSGGDVSGTITGNLKNAIKRNQKDLS